MAAAVALGAAALLLPSVASATPDNPAPSVAKVQQELGALALKNTQLVERYNQAQVEVAAKQKAAEAAQRTASTARGAFEKARLAMGATVAAQYEGGTFSSTGALLSSNSGQNYLDQLNTLGIISAHTARVVAQLSAVKASADSAQHHADALLKEATSKRDALAKQKARVQAQVDKYTTLLASLTAAQRAAYESTVVPPVSQASLSAVTASLNVASTSDAATRAVKFALAQVGKPYVYGAAGPDAYDCSGLTMASWAAGGVALPHSAADQYNYGTHVSISSLMPGDLVFFYQPIGHVTIYIGDGLMVSAPQTGENVSVVPLNSFDGSITGATRLVS